jgi:cytochrome c biogenesis factor
VVYIGFSFLTLGLLFGALWAKKAWGHYWTWDPKETWALVSIVVYAIVIHARFVPGMRGIFAFNFMSVISFASIVMTYFGVNFYLSGLHSYAQGEPQKTPVFIVYFGLGIIILGILAYLKHNKYLKNKSGSII